MESFGDRCIAFFKNLHEGVRRDPVRVAIPASHVRVKDKTGTLVPDEAIGTSLTPGEHYFQVLVNEMYLRYSRKWWVDYDAMVFAVSEFIYKGEFQTVPFIIGPAMMKKYTQEDTAHIVFENTRVAGLHPWRGGRLNLAVILYAVKRGDRARDLFRVVEGAAKVVDFGNAFSTYAKVAGVVLDGAEVILGLEDTKPIVGLRSEFDQDRGFKTGYYALISSDFQGDAQQLWVCEGRLSQDEAGKNPFRKADYVLYSVVPTSKRTDIDLLPFTPLWERVAREGMDPGEQAWESAQANWASLYQDIRFSSDLTKKQAKELAEEWKKELNTLHEERPSHRAEGEEPESPELAEIRSSSLAIFRE